jgi:hypothetical protein
MGSGYVVQSAFRNHPHENLEFIISVKDSGPYTGIGLAVYGTARGEYTRYKLE